MSPIELIRSNNINIFVYAIFLGIFGLIIWLLLRELRCWYFKINKRIELLENINDKLGIIVEKLYKEEKIK